MVKYSLAMRVKNIARSGWMMRGISPSDSETVSSHIFEVAFLSMLIADRLRDTGVDVDISKVIKLALIHDVTESVIGDIVRSVKENIVNSQLLEERALRELGLESYLDLYQELAEGRTLESQLVKICDNLATLLQGLRYVNKGHTSVIDLVESTKSRVEEILKSEQIKEETRRILSEVVMKLLISEEF
ncbi:MAG: HD family hydrolase [Sulfolobales archaeon]|nr:HD family hydrolase [Sulfolobales archaeon]MDW8082442.1 HD family hydrolase [Sulfolobales archaeon]